MTDRRGCGSNRQRALLVATLALALVPACGGRRNTPPPPPKATPSMIESLKLGGTPELQPYLDAYPLGTGGTRVDLLAATPKRSMHLVQTRRAIPRHVHPARTETVYVIRGSGTCYVGERSYPTGPGSTFKFAPGVAHSVLPSEGSTIVAISYFEPPLTEGDDRVQLDK